MNVPALSERTLQRDIAKGGITTGSEIQVCSNIMNVIKVIIKLYFLD